MPVALPAQVLPTPDAVGLQHNRALAATQAQAAALPDPAALQWLATHLQVATHTSQAQVVANQMLRHRKAIEQQGLSRTLALLRLPPADDRLIHLLFALPDTLHEDAWRERMALMRAQAEADPANHPVSRYLLAVADHSNRYWSAVGDSDEVVQGLPPGRYLSDSVRRIKRRRIAKADAGGLLKGITFGIIQFGSGVWFLDIPQNESAVLGSITAVLFSVFDSFSYGRKLRNGQVKLEDDPWWGPPVPADTTRPFVVPRDDSYGNR